jgi:hypothetical protein
MRRHAPGKDVNTMRNSKRRLGALLAMRHVLPYDPTVGVHAPVAWVPFEENGGAITELRVSKSLGSLSPAVRVPPVSFGIAAGAIVHDSAVTPPADMGFWDCTTVTSFSDESGLSFGDASKLSRTGPEGECLPDSHRLPGPGQNTSGLNRLENTQEKERNNEEADDHLPDAGRHVRADRMQ